MFDKKQIVIKLMQNRLSTGHSGNTTNFAKLVGLATRKPLCLFISGKLLKIGIKNNSI